MIVLTDRADWKWPSNSDDAMLKAVFFLLQQSGDETGYAEQLANEIEQAYGVTRVGQMTGKAMNTDHNRIAVIHAANDKRYRKLRAEMLLNDYLYSTRRTIVIGKYVADTAIGLWVNGQLVTDGPTFDAAVDALPEPESAEQAREIA